MDRIARNKAYLETHVCSLSGSDVLAGVGHSDDRDVIVMAAQEFLCARDDVADDDGSSEREDNVLVVGVKLKAAVHLA